MKKALKILSLILVLALFAGMAIGSGSSKSDQVKEPSSVTSGGQDVAPSSSGNTSDNSSSSSASAPEVTIEEAVILDQGGLKITAKSFDQKGSLFGPELKLLIENNSAKSLTVQTRNASVNGYMIETMMSVSVAAGKKANDTLTFSSSDITNSGITTFADMEFSFHVFDSDTWDTVFDSDIIRIETSAAEGFNYTFDDSGNKVYDENGLEIVVKGLSEGGSWLGPEVVVYIYNASGKDLTIQTRNVSINGFMVDPIFSADVANGKHAVDTISFMSSELEENDIESIESIELSFHVFDFDSWNTIVDTAPVTINFD